jgi:all-trans-8'-apo-beta-carotenal 15,15'-oxygenase
MLRGLTGIGDFNQLFSWKPALGTEVIVVPIDDPSAPIRFKTDAFYQWHFANAFGRAGEVVVDYVHYPDFSSFHELGRLDTLDHPVLAQGRYRRAVIDLRARTLRSEQVSDLVCEFPRVHPRVEGAAHAHAWITLGDLAGLGRVDLATGAVTAHHVPAHQRVTEPIFVPRAGATDEADGHVLALCFDGARDESFVAVYDGRDLAAGPVARVWLGYAVPITFHGVWVAA